MTPALQHHHVRAVERPRLVVLGEAGPVTLLDHLRQSQPHAVRQNVARNLTLFSEGDSTDCVYVLVKGTVRLCKHTPGGRRHVIDFVLPGEVFGLVEQPEHTMTAEAVSDAVLVSFSRSQLDRYAAANPVVRRRILSVVSDNLATAQQQLLILGCHDARERLASFLLRLADRAGLGAGNRLALPMGRQDIADHLGLTIETVCRTIRQLCRDGIVSVPGIHDIVLADMAALSSLAIEI